AAKARSARARSAVVAYPRPRAHGASQYPASRLPARSGGPSLIVPRGSPVARSAITKLAPPAAQSAGEMLVIRSRASPREEGAGISGRNRAISGSAQARVIASASSGTGRRSRTGPAGIGSGMGMSHFYQVPPARGPPRAAGPVHRGPRPYRGRRRGGDRGRRAARPCPDSLFPMGFRRSGPFQAGDQVQLTDPKDKRHTITLREGGVFHSH